ncbi:ACT domain-containing protein [Levilactobacillus acidifarinae]|uniref:UPF0237 protein FD25_GL001888 n=1 Tax=Levilactobacillus acidifarinae DSM 19394 = JCM 15949 TaxID=1423715 RepID=A0A0R1LVF6_9LACO|nr:ACT domain-containing protein [Levilactobacillus acidifarinae]KRK96394.1 hypothetical protein FD25_GL001888 [Levilactobacillus acidifarinae DSM 19394]GEO69021.1 UPF0237 protein [Levilactobacillus acidifarinae]
MRAIITVIGHDHVGIVAAVANELAQHNMNIVDISQTIMDQNFTMMLLSEWDEEALSFVEAKQLLEQLGQTNDLTIRMQRQAVFDAIQKL